MIVYIFNNMPTLGGEDWASKYVLPRSATEAISYRDKRMCGWPALAPSETADDCVQAALEHGWFMVHGFNAFPMRLERVL